MRIIDNNNMLTKITSLMVQILHFHGQGALIKNELRGHVIKFAINQIDVLALFNFVVIGRGIPKERKEG